MSASASDLIHSIPPIAWVLDGTGAPAFLSRRWYEYTDMPEDTDPARWVEWVHPEDLDRCRAIFEHAARTCERYHAEHRLRHRDGEYRWCIADAYCEVDDSGRPTRWIGATTDVHYERTGLDEMRRSEQRFLAVARATNDIVYDWDITRGTVWWSDQMQSGLGVSREQLEQTIGGWADRIHPDDRQRVTDSLTAAVEGDAETWSEEYRWIRGDGSTALLLDRGAIIRDRDGTPRRMIGSVLDLTERRRLEEDLRQAQKMDAIGKLAGGVAHDFNNLLTVISSYADVLLEELPEDSDWRNDASEIRRATDRAATLTRQLLTFSRRQFVQPTIVDVHAIAHDMEKMLARLLGEDILLSVECAAETPTIRADRGQIEQILLNLSVNARDAMRTGGTLSITTRNRPTSSDDPLAPESGCWLVLTAADTGIGMDEATAARIFEPFFTTRELGTATGLGLSTVYGIVQQAGGRIEVHTRPGAGARFDIFLPTTAAPATRSVQRSQGAELTGDETILLVEDEDGVRRVAASVLRRRGYDVHVAADGEKALDLLADGLRPDLVLTDLVMPMLGGGALAQRISALGLQPAILFMSGYSEDEIYRRGVLDRGTSFISKPFTIEQLAGAVRYALDHRAVDT